MDPGFGPFNLAHRGPVSSPWAWLGMESEMFLTFATLVLGWKLLWGRNCLLSTRPVAGVLVSAGEVLPERLVFELRVGVGVGPTPQWPGRFLPERG